MSGNVPELRFAGFTDPWEQRKLRELGEFNPKAMLPDYFEYVDLESVVGTEMIGHRRENRAMAPSRAQRIAQTGDIFYQTVRPYQRNNYLYELPDEDYVFSTGYAQIRPSIDSRFLFFLLQQDSFVADVLDRCTGTSYPAINADDLADIEVSVPADTEEQKLIGHSISVLENLITLHQRKHDQLATLKKSLLEKMFPKPGSDVPELRFAGFTDPWEQRKLRELGEFNPKAMLPDYFEYVDLESVVGTEMIGHRRENRAMAPSRAQRIAQTGDIFYQTVRPYQRNNYLYELPDEDYVFSTGYAQIRPSIDSRFLFFLLQQDSFVADVLDRCTGTSYPAINADDLADIEVSVPADTEEQKLIGHSISVLENLITLHQRKHDQLVTLKKSLLEKMFV